MTEWLDVSDTTPRIAYTATASQTVFPVPFIFFEDADLKVYQNGTLLTLSTHYAVTGEEDEDGGSVILVTGATVGDEVMIVRDITIEQTTHFPPGGPFDIAGLNLQISRVIAILQQMQNEVDRTVRLADSVSGEMEITEPAAGEYLKWNTTEDGIESAAVVTSSDSYAVATQSEAEAGSLNTVLMTPLRTAQAIDAQVTSTAATENSCGGRLTLASGTPVTESDLTGQTTIYYTPSLHDYIEYYSGSAWLRAQISELSLALDSNSGHTGYHQSGKNFFLGVFDDSGTKRLGSSVAWTSDTSTGSGAGTCEIELFQGRLVNKVSMVVRWGSSAGNTTTVAARQFTIVGGFRATGDGMATDSLAKRFVSNLQNPTLRPMRVLEASANWNYSTASYRQANNSTANQLDWFHCVAGRPVTVSAFAIVTNSTSTVRSPALAIGIDSATVAATGILSDNVGVDNRLVGMKSLFVGFAGIGRHYGAWLEYGGGADTQTWYGNSLNAGLIGETLN